MPFVKIVAIVLILLCSSDWSALASGAELDSSKSNKAKALEKVPGLTATSAQRLAAAVDAAGALATGSEQLVGTSKSLTDAEDTAGLTAHLFSLGGTNIMLRQVLQNLVTELGQLFSTGKSSGMKVVLRQFFELSAQDRMVHAQTQTAAREWIDGCKVPEIKLLYQKFQHLCAEHASLETEIRKLGGELHPLRDQRAAADGRLAGLEDLHGIKRKRRRGEEYEVARYLGSSLFRWELLRTKVAHHLAYTFSTAQEDAKRHSDSAKEDVEEAERQLGILEEKLQHTAGAHKRLSEQKNSLGKRIRSFLKSLLSKCNDAESGASSLHQGSDTNLQIMRTRNLGVQVQALEEFSRFLSNAFKDTVPQTVLFLEEVLEPYLFEQGYVLPTTWKPQPKIGRWWEWLDGWWGKQQPKQQNTESSDQKPLSQKDFERRFADAKRRFAVRVSAAEPVVMAYILWLILEDVLGTSTVDDRKEVLALPSPDESMVEQKTIRSKTDALGFSEL